MENTGRETQIKIQDRSLAYRVIGAGIQGEDTCLARSDDDLTAGLAWSDAGYTLQTLFNPDEFKTLQCGLTELVLERLKRALKKTISAQGFSLEGYHRLVDSESDHRCFMEDLRRGFSFEQFPIDATFLDRHISGICGRPVSHEKTESLAEPFYVRIVRPQGKRDYNPPHRDAWIPSLRNGLNLYVPISGSNALSSLPLIPGSHLWPESEVMRTREGAEVDGISYVVPAVMASTKPLAFVRPNPRPQEALIFSPYLVHGGGVNWNEDVTRVSLEMRFWRKPCE